MKGDATAWVASDAAAGPLFDRNAARYDLVNTLITFGQDRRWRAWAARRALALAAQPPPGERPALLDACAGTGLVGLAAARRGARVTLADASPVMLERARRRAAARRLAVTSVVTDLAAPPPFAPASFDAATLAFGLRYLPDPAATLRALSGLLRHGGALVVLESVGPSARGVARVGTPPSFPDSATRAARRAAAWYFFEAAPRIGAAVAGRRELYERLTATTASFGGAAELRRLLAAAGLEPLEEQQWAFGLVVGVAARPAVVASRPVGGGAGPGGIAARPAPV